MNAPLAALLPAALFLSAPAKPTEQAPVAPRDAVRFTVDAKRRIYDVGINFAYQTTVWTPVDCEAPAIGDPEYFSILYDPKKPLQRRFILTAQVEKAGATTNVTFDCQSGVRIVLKVTQVQASDAALSVEFEFDAEENARVQAAVEAERQRVSTECEGRIADLHEQLELEAQDRFVRGMLRRLLLNDDEEHGRQNFVIVKAYRQILAGEKGYIVFSVQNRTSQDFVVGTVEVIDEHTRQPLATQLAIDRRVAPDTLVAGVATFDAPEEPKSFTLVVREDGPREIRVEDIDF
jgi:hypothetical protein